ncbi:hypothetical protein KIN20_030317 [Parelaphostrongylus tenuis]|uniref:Uncharacterized protein n=1 Tax=Parelaphostrongylus tenuis TaxID=148309 RepID=A0AAD5R3Y9_PARTN|nr:hypothetical protein KIN20_030317 [Parelaphostrongylus tenuis]
MEQGPLLYNVRNAKRMRQSMGRITHGGLPKYQTSAANLLDKSDINLLIPERSTTCKFCQLPAAFHEEKCVYCSHSERKFGAPIPCANCKLRAAFTKDPKKLKPTLCRMCVIQARANKQTNLAGVTISLHDHYSGHKRKREEKKKADKEAEPTKVPKRDPFADSVENVILVQQLRDQISKLNSVVAQKDAAMLEKDKKIAALQADLMSAERKHREKVDQLIREKNDAIRKIIDTHRQASKQVKK